MLPCTCFTASDASRQNQFSLATTKIYEAGSRTTKTTCDASQRTKTPKQLLIPANRQPSMPVTHTKKTASSLQHLHQNTSHQLQRSDFVTIRVWLESNRWRQTRTGSLLTLGVLARVLAKKQLITRQRSHPMTRSRSFREIKEFPPGKSCSRHGLLGESRWPGPGEPSSRQSWRQPC